MIYHFSLQAAGIFAGLLLLFLSIPGLVKPEAMRNLAARFPRSRAFAVALLTIDLIWSLWLLATMEMGEFSTFRRPLLIALPIGYILTIRFVNELLAVRALGILCLLLAEPLLDAAFFRYEPSRMFVTVFAYLLIVAGLFWVTMPYLLRDQLQWSTRNAGRCRLLNGVLLIYGAVILAVAVMRY
jgi:hypothetical protein